MSGSSNYPTEQSFQVALARLLRQVGWLKVDTEVWLADRRFRADIVASGRIGSHQGLVIECKRQRPESLPKAIRQIASYRRAVSNRESFKWCLSWPTYRLTPKDFDALYQEDLYWMSPNALMPIRKRKV